MPRDSVHGNPEGPMISPEEQVARLEAAFDVLAHEGRNCLGPLTNTLKWMQRMAALDPTKDIFPDQFAIMARQLRRLNDLMTERLDYTRIRQGMVNVSFRRFELATVIKEITDGLRGEVEGSGLTLICRLPTQPIITSSAPDRIEQVVTNLITNAMKFTDPGGTITVSVTEESSRCQAVVVVSDTGIGIDEDTAETLFQPFAQAKRSRERSRGGVGLGLAIAKGLMELLGGEIKAESAGVGQGSTFTITIPILESRNHGTELATLEPSASMCRRILIVEDNRDAADTLSMLLELYGQIVEVAYTGPEAITKAEAFGPDVVLCDIGLPVMSGYAVVEALQQNPAHSKCHFIAVTGYSPRGEMARESGALRFATFLTKPVNIEELLETLEQLG